jgi:hypothetical protein
LLCCEIHTGCTNCQASIGQRDRTNILFSSQGNIAINKNHISKYVHKFPL